MGLLGVFSLQCTRPDPGGERRAFAVGTCRLTMKVPSGARVDEPSGKVRIEEGAMTRHPRTILLEAAPPHAVVPPSAVQRGLAPGVVLSAVERVSLPGEGNDESGASALEGALAAHGCALQVTCHERGQEPGWCVCYLATIEPAA